MLKEDEGVIDKRVYMKGNDCKTIVALKSSTGILQIDARKWFRFPNTEDFFPTKKGLMLDLPDWDIVLPMIQELISQSKGQNDGKNEKP